MSTEVKSNAVMQTIKIISVLLLGHLISAEARSLKPSKTPQKDPIMALPSDQQAHEVQYVTYEHMLVPAVGSDEQRHEMEYHPQSAEEMVRQQQARSSNEQSGAEVTSEPPHSHNGAACNERHEYEHTAKEVERAEGEPEVVFPNDVIYLGQNDASLKSNMRVAATSLSSDLSATILTEIPIRDMPHEVLAKLKRDYGVKVVATRERPGANLIINCEDALNREISICERQAVQTNKVPADTEVYQPQPGVAEYQGPMNGMPPRHHHQSFQIEHVVAPDRNNEYANGQEMRDYGEARVGEPTSEENETSSVSGEKRTVTDQASAERQPVNPEQDDGGQASVSFDQASGPTDQTVGGGNENQARYTQEQVQEEKET